MERLDTVPPMEGFSTSMDSIAGQLGNVQAEVATIPEGGLTGTPAETRLAHEKLDLIEHILRQLRKKLEPRSE